MIQYLFTSYSSTQWYYTRKLEISDHNLHNSKALKQKHQCLCCGTMGYVAPCDAQNLHCYQSHLLLFWASLLLIPQGKHWKMPSAWVLACKEEALLSPRLKTSDWPRCRGCSSFSPYLVLSLLCNYAITTNKSLKQKSQHMSQWGKGKENYQYKGWKGMCFLVVFRQYPEAGYKQKVFTCKW